MPQPPIAERIRRACLEAFRRAYDDAGMAGLCEDGRIEAALSAVRELDLEAIAAGDAPEGTP